MNGAPDRLPPLWEVNHQIPLIDRNKRYKYHMLRCPNSLKNKLGKKIACYTCAKWWEPTQTEQAAPMLCIKKNTLRMVIDRQQQNDNTVKDVTPLLNQDIIRLDIVRAKIHSKIDLSDTYKPYQKTCIKPHLQHNATGQLQCTLNISTCNEFNILRVHWNISTCISR